MEHKVRIIEIKEVTHDVRCFRLEKPEGYEFSPGQATDVSIPQTGWETELRPFTFTALNSAPYLEFTIKRYPERHGVTDRLHQLKTGDELVIRDVWGAINYQGEGYFIAGGAGITPFMAILRDLHQKKKTGANKLFFSNKTERDIIYKEELEQILGANALFTLTREKNNLFEFAKIDRSFLKKHVGDLKRHFYVCGPDPMVAELTSLLQDMGATTDSVIFEK